MEAVPHSEISSAAKSSPSSRLPAQVGVVAAVVVMLACMGVIFAGQFSGHASHNGSNVVIGAAK